MSGPIQPSSNTPGTTPTGKAKTGTTIRTETTTFSENGVTETVVTRIVTDHFGDGTSSSRRETQTTREEEVTGGGGIAPRPLTPTPLPPPPQQKLTGSGSQAQGQAQAQQLSLGVSQLGLVSHSSRVEEMRPDDVFIDEALRCHNKYRTKHNVPPLSVSHELCKAAQSWADQLAQKGTMENSHFGYGENIYWSSGPGHAMKGDVPVEYWYHEEIHFDWAKMDFQKNTGSFSQLIWKDSKQFGIAKASGSKGTFVVAFYIPPGNVLSKFHENVYHPSTQSA